MTTRPQVTHGAGGSIALPWFVLISRFSCGRSTRVTDRSAHSAQTARRAERQRRWLRVQIITCSAG
jgi:hypothetical protein